MTLLAEPVPAIAPAQPILSGEDYIRSLRGRGLRVFLFGELVRTRRCRKRMGTSSGFLSRSFPEAGRSRQESSASRQE